MEDKWNKLKNKATEVALEAKQRIDESAYKSKLSEAIEDSKKYLNDKGVTEKVSLVSDSVSHQLDSISGQKILQKLEERIELQDRYNDILATKLGEALDRIAILEDQLFKEEKTA